MSGQAKDSYNRYSGPYGRNLQQLCGRMHLSSLFSMKKLILFFLVLFYSITAFCQHSFKQNLKNVATIILPDTPKIEYTKRGTIYIVRKNRVIYISQVAQLNKNLEDFLTEHLADSIYEGFIKGSLKDGGTLFYKKNIYVNGLHGIEFGYVKRYDSITSYRYHQSFYFNNILIANGFWSRDSLRSDNKEIKAFFSTFKLTIREVDVDQGNLADKVFNWRTVLIIGSIFLLGILIIYIIRRLTYK
jgi:hypothetical protein